MKIRTILPLVASALSWTSFSPTSRAEGLDRLGSRTFNLLAPEERGNWKTTSGHWDFEAQALIGTGESRIDYARPFLTPVHITFDVEVIDGVRPRIYFGRYSLAHEGFSGRFFGLYPSQDKHKRFRYETGHKYPVVVDITKEHMEVRIAGHVLDSRDAGLELVPSLGFSSGDSYSKGMTRFYNITVFGVPSAGVPVK